MQLYFSFSRRDAATIVLSGYLSLNWGFLLHLLFVSKKLKQFFRQQMISLLLVALLLKPFSCYSSFFFVQYNSSLVAKSYKVISFHYSRLVELVRFFRLERLSYFHQRFEHLLSLRVYYQEVRSLWVAFMVFLFLAWASVLLKYRLFQESVPCSGSTFTKIFAVSPQVTGLYR